MRLSAFSRWARLVRLPLLPTALADSWAGFLIATLPGHPPAWPVLGALAAASGGLYLGGMVLNDVADLERDKRIHPARPLPSGEIGKPLALLLYLGLTGGGLAAACALGALPASLALALTAAVMAYNLVLKSWRLPGCLAMGTCRGLNLALGIAAGGAAAGFPISAPLILGAYVAGVTLVSTFEETNPGAARWVGILLRGIIPLDAAMVACHGRPLAALGILALLPLALGLRRILPRHE